MAGIDPAYLARTATLYFHLSGATYDEMFETWFMIEPAVAEKVAALPDRPRVRRSLEPFIAELPPDVDTDVFFTMSTGFHAELAKLSGNRVFGLLVQAIGHTVVDHIMLDLDPVQERRTIERDHRKIAEAITAGRTQKARNLMSGAYRHHDRDLPAELADPHGRDHRVAIAAKHSSSAGLRLTSDPQSP